MENPIIKPKKINFSFFNFKKETWFNKKFITNKWIRPPTKT